MKWFDKWFYGKARWAWARAKYEYPEVKHRQDYLDNIVQYHHSEGLVKSNNRLCNTATGLRDDVPMLDWRDGLTINIRKVVGGFVVQFRQYGGNHKDDTTETIHLITDDKDFNQALGHLMTLESLR